mgnify:CR=1 FL=1
MGQKKIFYDIGRKNLALRAYFLFWTELSPICNVTASPVTLCQIWYDKNIALTLIAFSVCSDETHTDMQDINVSTAFAFTSRTGVLVSETVCVHTPT